MYNSSVRKTTKVTARILMFLLAFCLVIAVAPNMGISLLPKAGAASEYNLNSSNVSTINSNLSTYSKSDPGCTVNIVLTGDIDLTDLSADKYTTGFTGITVPAGITVNLYLNAHLIKFDRESDGAWQLPYVYGIVNNGTLNVYSGSGPSSKNASAASTSASAIFLRNKRGSMKAQSASEEAYTNLECIRNYGTLTVNKNVSLYAEAYLVYTDNGGGCDASASCAVTGVNQAGSNAKCTIDAVQMKLSNDAQGWTSKDRRGHSRVYAYGVYGGDVKMLGKTDIDIYDYTFAHTSSTTDDDHTARNNVVAYGICTSGSVEVYGGTISWNALSDCNASNGIWGVSAGQACKNGFQRVYSGAIMVKSGVIPVIADGTFRSTTDKQIKSEMGTMVIYEGTVVCASTIPLSGSDYLAAVKGDARSDSDYPNVTVSASKFYDEARNSYNGALVSVNGSHPVSIINGAAEGTYRVHVIYRYWLEQSKNNVDTSVVGSTGLVGYSFLPLNDATDIVKSKATFSGMNSSVYTKTASASVKFSSGAAVYNSNYWTFFNCAWATPSDEFSDINFTSASNKGLSFYTASNNQGSAIGADSTAPIFIYVDYYRNTPTTIKASAGTNNSVFTTYTGSPIVPSALDLKITNTTGSKVYTSDYNIDLNDYSKIAVSYSYTGKNAAGEDESGTDSLPTNAGTYTVTMHIDDQSEYTSECKDEKLFKNRKALDYQFTLTINPAKVTRGNLPASVNLVYGTKLSSVLPMATYQANGINGEGAQQGVFSFTTAADGNVFKPVGNNTVQITWTPADSVFNYEPTTFTVNYAVSKAALVIRPNAATVEYGETAFITPFSVTIEGLAGNDDTDAVKQTIAGALTYMINKNGSWIAYSPDQVGAGTYSIRATFEGQLPEVMSNYSYTYAFGPDNNEFGNLLVNKRGLTVTATAVSREYEYENRSVNVTFVVTDGIYGIDDVSVATTVGAISNYNVGTRAVTGIDKAKVQANLTGGAAANYVVEEVIFTTGSSLTVEITKATPVVGTPTTDDRYYQMGATLADVQINSAESSVSGTWQWVDISINPTVNVKTYQAKFVPADSANYNEKVVDVSLNVKATPVVITYEKTVQYGDKKPNITDFTFIVAQDPTFDFDKLDCEGNISVTTTYEQGSAVSATGYPVTISASNYTDKAGNYTFTVRNGVIYVTKRTVTFTVQPVTITYGSNFVLNNSTVTVTANTSDLYGSDTVNSVTANGEAPTFTFTSDYSAQTNYGAGTYTVSAHNNFTTSANYDVAFVDGTLTVAKADLVISAKPITVEYNTAVSDETLAGSYTVSGAKKNETLAQMMTEGTIKVDTTYYKGAAVNTEGYPVTIDITECKFPNYNVTVNNSVITVIKATPVITELPTASLVHNQTLSQAVFTGGAVEGGIAGTFAYNSNIAVVYSSEPYNYPATFIPEDTANYNTVAIPALTLYVSKLAVTGELSITGVPMTGETLTIDVSGLNPAEQGVYSFVWMCDDVQIATGLTYRVEEVYVGKTVTAVATANGYYDGVKTSVSPVIAPRLTSIETILDSSVYANYFTLGGMDTYKGITTIEYDGSEHIASFTLSNSALSTTAVGAVTVKYNGSTTVPTNAGYYTVSIDVGTPSYSTITEKDGKTYDSAAGKFVYSPVSGYEIGTLYISPKDYTVTLTFNDKVYDGSKTTTAVVEETGACTLAGGIKDDVAYDKGAATYSFTDANAGNGKNVSVSGAVLKGESAANYNLVIVKANNGTADITPRTLDATVEPISRTYEKDNYTVYLGFTVDTTTLAPTDSITQVYVDDTFSYGIIDDDGAGTRFVTVYDAILSGSKAGNYVLNLTNETNLTVEIAKAIPSYPIPSTGVVYYDSARSLSEISLGYDNWQWDESVRNIIPTAGTHTYKAVFTPNDTENEATVVYNVKLVVNKATVTIKIASFNNVVYGDNVPTYYYTATGLTGTDTIKKNVDGYILLDSNYSAGSPVGTYSIVRSGEFESDNYSFVYLSGAITVNPRTVYTTVSAEAREYEPGNKNVTVSFSELTNIYAGDAASVYLNGSNPTTGTVATDTAGTKKVTYTTPTLAGDKASNYTLYVNNANLNVEIKKAVISGIVFPASGTVNYGQRLSETVLDEPYDAKGLGTFSMENPTTSPENVGTFTTGYNVVFTPADSANYATVSQPIRLTVQTATLSGVTVQLAGTTQVGKTLYANVSNVPAAASRYVTYNWYRVDSPDADYREGFMIASGTDSYKLTEAEQGKYIVCVATTTAGSPYSFATEARTDENISAETLSFWQRLVKWFYKIMSGLTQLFGKVMG